MSRLLLVKKPLIDIERPKLIVPNHLRGNRSRLERFPAPWVRRYTRLPEIATAPSFGAAGTVGVGDTGALTDCIATYPTGIGNNTSGMSLFAFVFGDDGVSGSTNWNTPAGWTSIGQIGGSTRRSSNLFWKNANSESGTLTIVNGAGGAHGTGTSIAVIFRYSGALTSGATEAYNNSVGGTTAVAPSSITTTHLDELALCFIAFENVNTCSSIAGNTGGTWTQDNLQQSTYSVAANSAPLASIGTISGGSATLGAANSWHQHSVALMSTLNTVNPSLPPRYMSGNQAVNRASRW